MLYYRPKIEKYDHFTGWTTIPGELLTEKERIRRFRYLQDSIFEKVRISQKKTYKMFGARFPFHHEELMVIESEIVTW